MPRICGSVRFNYYFGLHYIVMTAGDNFKLMAGLAMTGGQGQLFVLVLQGW